MSYLEKAADQVRAVAEMTARLAARAADLRKAAQPAHAEVIEADVVRRNMWLADRLLALAAIERGLPPCCCHGGQAGTEET